MVPSPAAANSPERNHRAAAQQTDGRDAAALGEALRVRWVVTGSFQRACNRALPHG